MDHVLYEIFSYLLTSDQAVMARVCRQWFHCVIPHLYKTVCISQAVAPLGELVLQPDNYFQFRDPIAGYNRLERFLVYAIYVQSLIVNDERYSLVVQKLAWWSNQTTPGAFPFPRLRFLQCAGGDKKFWDNMSALLPPSVDYFSLCAFECSQTYFHSLYRTLTANRTDLYFLNFDSCCDLQDAAYYVSIFEKLLEYFAHTLVWVQLPEMLITSSLLTRLANIKNLCNLAIGPQNPHPLADPDPIRITKGYTGANGQGNFDVLRQLYYYELPTPLCDAFLLSHNLTSVSSFHWDFDFTKEIKIEYLFTMLHRLFPSLTSLQLGSSDMYDFHDVGFDDIPLLEWSSLYPVLGCQHLTELSVHVMRLSITQEQLVDILRNRSSWKKLELYAEEPFGFQEINLFAQHCPNLRHLGLYFDLTYREDSLGYLDHSATFQHLQSIDFAYSALMCNCVHIVARYFYGICKNPPRLFGWEMETWDMVERYIADFYVDEERKTGRPMSSEARDYVEQLGVIN